MDRFSLVARCSFALNQRHMYFDCAIASMNNGIHPRAKDRNTCISSARLSTHLAHLKARAHRTHASTFICSLRPLQLVGRQRRPYFSCCRSQKFTVCSQNDEDCHLKFTYKRFHASHRSFHGTQNFSDDKHQLRVCV